MLLLAKPFYRACRYITGPNYKSYFSSSVCAVKFSPVKNIYSQQSQVNKRTSAMSSSDVIDLAAEEDAIAAAAQAGSQAGSHTVSQAVLRLVDMGFGRAAAEQAMARCGSEEVALDALLSGTIANYADTSHVSASESTSVPVPVSVPVPMPVSARAAVSLRPQHDKGAGQGPVSLTVCTYNIWFEHPHTYAVRMEAISALVNSATGPAVLALQEVTQSQSYLLGPGLRQGGWRPLSHQANAGPYYVSLATRGPCGALNEVRTHDFPGSVMGRALVYGESDSPLGRIVCGTVHLESFVPGIPEHVLLKERRKQLIEAGEVMLQHARSKGLALAVLMGDTNWKDNKDNSNAAEVAIPEWTDAFIAAGSPEDCRYTYDGKASAMMGHYFRNRFDRIFYWINPDQASTRGIKLDTISFLGTSPIPGEYLEKTVNRKNKPPEQKQMPLLPSDHFGLCATFVGRGATDAHSAIGSNSSGSSSSSSSSSGSGSGSSSSSYAGSSSQVTHEKRSISTLGSGADGQGQGKRACLPSDATGGGSEQGSQREASVEDVRAARLMRFQK
jgi:hypothetical protein